MPTKAAKKELGGRPKLPPERRRDRDVHTTVTAAELELLKAGARVAGRSLADYVRHLLLDRLGIAREEG